MRRYLSHYAFIYPDIYLKNYIMEINDGRIVSYFPFEKEIEKTEFYSGLLVFLPESMDKEEIIQRISSDKNMYSCLKDQSVEFVHFKLGS